MKPLASQVSGRFLLSIILAALMSIVLISVAFTSNTARPNYVPDEYIIHVRFGTTVEDARQAVAMMGGTLLRSLPLNDTYLIKMGVVTTGPVTRTPAYENKPLYSTVTGDALPGPWVIDRIQPNRLYYPTIEPISDPDWGNQWDMHMINMPGAWDIQKGGDPVPVTVAVLDTGVAYEHEDLIERCVPGYDFVDNDFDPYDEPGGGHGTHVAGTIAAQGDNGLGICGVCWDNVKIMPVRVLGPEGGTTEWIINGLDYALAHGAGVVNMSLGGAPRFGDEAYRSKLVQLSKAGVIVVAAAGNDGANAVKDVGVPALYPEVIAVGAVGPTEEIAYYSSYGPAYEVDIVAPGGDQRYGEEAGVYSTHISWSELEDGVWIGFHDYAWYQGTSMACPHVAGAAALLLSQGIPASAVRARLLQSARPPSVGEFDRRKFGAGILDVQAALSNASLRIVEPVKGSSVDGSPQFRIAMRGVDPSTIRVYADYTDANEDGIPDNLFAETPVIDSTNVNYYVNSDQTAVTFRWSDVSGSPLAAGRHFMYVRGLAAVSGAQLSDWIMFTVSGRTIPAGIHMFSFPYNLNYRSVLPSDILIDKQTGAGVDFSPLNPNRAVLKRYLPTIGEYAPYIPSNPGDFVWMNPTTSTLALGGGWYADRMFGEQIYTFPAGTGFWLILPSEAVINEAYSNNLLDNVAMMDKSRGYSVQLYSGWNMIGNPYAHSVPWQNMQFTFQGERKDLLSAAAAGWVSSSIFGYCNTGAPGYERLSNRDPLQPFEGYWVRAYVGGVIARDRLLLTILP